VEASQREKAEAEMRMEEEEKLVQRKKATQCGPVMDLITKSQGRGGGLQQQQQQRQMALEKMLTSLNN